MNSVCLSKVGMFFDRRLSWTPDSVVVNFLLAQSANEVKCLRRTENEVNKNFQAVPNYMVWSPVPYGPFCSTGNRMDLISQTMKLVNIHSIPVVSYSAVAPSCKVNHEWNLKPASATTCKSLQEEKWMLFCRKNGQSKSEASVSVVFVLKVYVEG